jgi:uncharacterized phiE125 gp8 family phage protein
VTQTWELVLDAFTDAILIPRGPVQSITSITYYDADEVLQTLATDQYVLDNVADPAWIVRPTDVTYPGRGRCEQRHHPLCRGLYDHPRADPGRDPPDRRPMV